MNFSAVTKAVRDIYLQTQQSVLDRSSEDDRASGVLLRVGGERVSYPQNALLHPLKESFIDMGCLVAVQMKNPAICAVFEAIDRTATEFFVDRNTSVQVMDTMDRLRFADPCRPAAFIRAHHVLVVWAYDIQAIVPYCHSLQTLLEQTAAELESVVDLKGLGELFCDDAVVDEDPSLPSLTGLSKLMDLPVPPRADALESKLAEPDLPQTVCLSDISPPPPSLELDEDVDMDSGDDLGYIPFAASSPSDTNSPAPSPSPSPRFTPGSAPAPSTSSTTRTTRRGRA
ncbi:hypothetical protein EW146_g7237, partial [Bondarzewia mesenterica]